MKTKSDYRSFFAKCKKYVKLSVLCNEIGVNQSALSRFMMDQAYDYVMSLETLDRLYIHLQRVLENIV